MDRNVEVVFGDEDRDTRSAQIRILSVDGRMTVWDRFWMHVSSDRCDFKAITPAVGPNATIGLHCGENEKMYNIR